MAGVIVILCFFGTRFTELLMCENQDTRTILVCQLQGNLVIRSQLQGNASEAQAWSTMQLLVWQALCAA
jgi:hypothetical protein